MLERFYLFQNVLITLRFLTLCASVGNKKVFNIIDARCNHEVYNSTSFFNCQFYLLTNARVSQVAPSYVCLIFHMGCTRTANHIFRDCVSLIIMVQIIYELICVLST